MGASATISAEALAVVDEAFSGQQASGAAPSAAWAVFDRTGVVHRGFAGALQHGAAPGAGSAYRIASCTKSFTSAAILALRDEGSLSLDDPITRFVPAFGQVRLPTSDSPVPTVRMLLTMSAGLPTDDPWGDRQEAMTVDGLHELLAAGLSFDSVPGTTFAYSNLGYALLGQVIEAASGQGYREFVRERLLQPLGLHDTAFEASAYGGSEHEASEHDGGGEARESAEAVVGARLIDGEWEYLPLSGPGVFSPIGGLFSTVDDLARWAGWLASAFEPEGADVAAAPSADAPADTPADHTAPDLTAPGPARTAEPFREPSREPFPGPSPLSRASRRELQQAYRIVLERSEHPMGYGFGLFVEHYEAQGPVISHSGGYPGFSAHMRWSAELGVGVIGFENATFSRVPVVTTAAFDGLLAALRPRGSATPPLAVWPETWAAAGRVSALLAAWDDEEARRVFTPNVELDMPHPQRVEALASALRSIGGLVEGEARHEASVAPSQLTWSLPGATGRLKVSIQLTPELPPRVQSLRVEAVAPAKGAMLG